MNMLSRRLKTRRRKIWSLHTFRAIVRFTTLDATNSFVASCRAVCTGHNTRQVVPWQRFEVCENFLLCVCYNAMSAGYLATDDFVAFSGNTSHSSAISSARPSCNMARHSLPSPLLLMMVLLLLVVAMVTTTSTKDRFDTTSFCKDACDQGLGGNACRCHSTLFAGKTTHDG